MQWLDIRSEDPDRDAFCKALAGRLADRIAILLPPVDQATARLTFFDVLTYSIADYDVKRDLRRDTARWRRDRPHLRRPSDS
ncbi:MAG: hypothetical protein P4L85_14050 [Paludisphaera borealis]|uniref:hypothetical protein n=1 Tax=Paludisphaera borealis TaxID=1387353 RepID=UPI002844C02A|nr:hypothetical protein [Paludisphaera borealis]MDR3620469.1 hypothetical protein [Paludisphaera borealis]